LVYVLANKFSENAIPSFYFLRMEIITANSIEQYEAAALLFIEYQKFLGVDLCFQDFNEELQKLPEMYGGVNGSLLMAVKDGKYVGCVAVRSKGNGVCEMKRLYVVEEAKSQGVGRQLAEAILTVAIELGFETMLLDTLQRLTAAHNLYISLGFTEIEPYYNNPLEAVVFMSKQLKS
jgi:putative acetyltransferase